MTFACLHSELDKAVFASYVWQVHIQDTAVVPIAVLCLFLYLSRNMVRACFRKRSST